MENTTKSVTVVFLCLIIEEIILSKVPPVNRQHVVKNSYVYYNRHSVEITTDNFGVHCFKFNKKSESVGLIDYLILTKCKLFAGRCYYGEKSRSKGKVYQG